MNKITWPESYISAGVITSRMEGWGQLSPGLCNRNRKLHVGTCHLYVPHVHLKDKVSRKSDSGLQPLKTCWGKILGGPCVGDYEKSPTVHNALLEYHHGITYRENSSQTERLSTLKMLHHRVFLFDDCHYHHVSPGLPHSLSTYIYFELSSHTSHCF